MMYYIGQGPSGTVRYYREARALYQGKEERMLAVLEWNNVPLGISQFRKEVYRLPME